MTTKTSAPLVTPEMQNAIDEAQLGLASAEIVAPNMIKYWERELSIALTVAYNYSRKA